MIRQAAEAAACNAAVDGRKPVQMQSAGTQPQEERK